MKKKRLTVISLTLLLGSCSGPMQIGADKYRISQVVGWAFTPAKAQEHCRSIGFDYAEITRSGPDTDYFCMKKGDRLVSEPSRRLICVQGLSGNKCDM